VTVDYQPALLAAASFTAVSLPQANSLLTEWGHYLGACERPFGAEGWVLEVAGEPVSVAVSASIVGPSSAGYPMREVVELARLCSAPSARWATRPMLRMWREVAGPAWRYWPVEAAVAYSQNSRHDGSIYRFDGWTRVRSDAGKSPGVSSTWTKQRDVTHPAAGSKSLWLWRYGRSGCGGTGALAVAGGADV
jgi:hypothetical protein